MPRMAILSKMKHRIGVQGLAEVCKLMRIALNASCEIAQKDGAYKTYQGSPMSEGKIQYDLRMEFSKEMDEEKAYVQLDEERHDWAELESTLTLHPNTLKSMNLASNWKKIKNVHYNWCITTPEVCCSTTKSKTSTICAQCREDEPALRQPFGGKNIK
eukprot:650891_1